MNLPFEKRTFDEHIDVIIYMALSISEREYPDMTCGTLEEFFGDDFWSRLTPIMAKHVYFRFINTCHKYGYQLYQDVDAFSSIFVKEPKKYTTTYFEADEL
ncbi:hypothetical protein [Thalassotalea aquiviva]|uniref:hypothetical protein n=1 Tax=Thalassotalea aquiviva TaxID=3242415 RepID=UPI00352A9907